MVILQELETFSAGMKCNKFTDFNV